MRVSDEERRQRKGLQSCRSFERDERAEPVIDNAGSFVFDPFRNREPVKLL